MPGKDFDLGDYVEVKDRIAIFFELYPQGRLVTRRVEIVTTRDGTDRVLVHALAYRTPDDPLPGTGTSWLALPGTTPYTKGSEVENAETSAWGRAIGSLGILIDRSIATSNEIQSKQSDAIATSTPVAESHDPYRETEELLGDFSGSGMVRLGTADGCKLESRDGPEGHVIGFRMEFKDEKAIANVIVEGLAGEALYLATGMNAGVLRDTRLHVKGRLSVVRSNRPRSQSWKRLRVLEWANADYKYPAEDVALPEPPEDLHLVGEKPDDDTLLAMALIPDDIGAK